MREADHPSTGKPVNVEAYLEEFGRLRVGHQGPDTRPKAACPYCSKPLHIVGDKSEERAAHFAHSPNSGLCPSKAPAGQPYLDLQPKIGDAAAGHQMRTRFVATWRQQFTRVSEMVPHLSMGEFIELLERADKCKLWEHAALTEGKIPYGLVTLADFSPATGIKSGGTPKRQLHFRFIYAAGVTRLEDLWIRPQGLATLFRLSYTAPAGGGAPQPTALLKRAEQSTHDKFLSGAARALSPTQVTWCEKWFAKNWPDVYQVDSGAFRMAKDDRLV